MTIKTRNHLNLIFGIFACLTFAFYIVTFIYQFLLGNLANPEVYFKHEPSTNFLFGYKKIFVYFGMFTELIYAAVCYLIIWRSFTKTQSSIITFFLLFLTGLFSDSCRLLIPCFHISNSFSSLLFAVGNACLFGRLLAPFALLLTILVTFDEQHQNMDRNCIILIISCMFIAGIIPINTARILPNFCIAYSFGKTISILTIAINIINVIILGLYNYKNDYKQITTLGFLLISAGYHIIFNCTSLFLYITGTAALVSGTALYIPQVHNHYLWK